MTHTAHDIVLAAAATLSFAACMFAFGAYEKANKILNKIKDNS